MACKKWRRWKRTTCLSLAVEGKCLANSYAGEMNEIIKIINSDNTNPHESATYDSVCTFYWYTVCKCLLLSLTSLYGLFMMFHHPYIENGCWFIWLFFMFQQNLVPGIFIEKRAMIQRILFCGPCFGIDPIHSFSHKKIWQS